MLDRKSKYEEPGIEPSGHQPSPRHSLHSLSTKSLIIEGGGRHLFRETEVVRERLLMSKPSNGMKPV